VNVLQCITQSQVSTPTTKAASCTRQLPNHRPLRRQRRPPQLHTPWHSFKSGRRCPPRIQSRKPQDSRNKLSYRGAARAGPEPLHSLNAHVFSSTLDGFQQLQQQRISNLQARHACQKKEELPQPPFDSAQANRPQHVLLVRRALRPAMHTPCGPEAHCVQHITTMQDQTTHCRHGLEARALYQALASWRHRAARLSAK
jgi:hypothetical protein